NEIIRLLGARSVHPVGARIGGFHHAPARAQVDALREEVQAALPGARAPGGTPYLVGPLARLNLNLDRLPAPVRTLADSLGIKFPSRNMYHSIVARAIEIVVAIREAIRLLEAYAEPSETYISVTPRAGTGYGCTEAPRGLLWHR